jgi:NNMT/PNMT/TEMT family
MADQRVAYEGNSHLAVKPRDMTPVPSNSDFDWDQFDSDWYHEHNYRSLRDDDHQIMVRIRDFFASAGVSHGSGVDVGAGSNLYPALAMMPFCDQVELREYSATNVDWLRRNVRDYGRSWDPFWEVYRDNPAYAAVEDPRVRLRTVAEVRQGSVFDLPQHRWDMGTMFFVACSLSADMAEFQRAIDCFLGALRPGAPFAVAFMEKSKGYPVDGVWYPAVEIDVSTVEKALKSGAYDGVQTDRITTNNPLRDGYDGAMIISVGRACG